MLFMVVKTNAYRFKTEGPTLKSVREKDAKKDITLYPESPDLAAFLSWRGRLSDPTFDAAIPISRGSVFFTELKDLVDHLKRRGQRLFIDQSDSNPEALEGKPIEMSVQSKSSSTVPVKYSRLATAVPALSNSDNVNRTKDGLESWRFSKIYVSQGLLHRLNLALKDETSDIRRLSSWEVDRTFVYVDISDFSKFPAGHQAFVIGELIDFANSGKYWEKLPQGEDFRTSVESALCIGDGYIFAFENPSSAVYFAAGMACIIDRQSARKDTIPIHFRVGVHTGPVRFFWDQCGPSETGKWNYVGTGIIDGERVLSSIGREADDIVFLSAETRAAVLDRPTAATKQAMTRHLQNRGRRADKHGTMRRLFELNHMGWLGRYFLETLDEERAI